MLFNWFQEKMYQRKKMAGLWKLLKHYGPDLATYGSRDLSIRDAQIAATEALMQEQYVLLPHRYRFILDALEREGLLKAETVAWHKEYGKWIFGGGAVWLGSGPVISAKDHPLPWIENPAILQNAPKPLQEKMKVFQKDVKILREAVWGITI